MPDQVVEFEGAKHVFPGDFSPEEISQALGSMHPQAQQPNPETFGQGFRSTLPIGGTGFGPGARLKDFIGMAANQIASMKDSYDKAVDAHSKGRDFEALTHLVGVVPFIGTALHHAGETLGGTEAQFDKYGNIIKPGLQPNPAGATGEALGLAAPSLIDAATGAPKAIGGAVTATREALSKPGTGKIALGTGEVAAGGAALLHGNLWGMYPLARGVKTLGKGLTERAGAAATAADAELEQFAPGFSKLNEKDQAITRMVYDRIKNGPPPAGLPPGPVAGPLLTPPIGAPGKTIADIAREELAASPAAAPAQATQAATPAPAPTAVSKPAEAVPSATSAEPFKQRARAARGASADTLAQGLQNSGTSSGQLASIPRFRWRDIARAHGVDWPATANAQFNLIRDTLDALKQREKTEP